MFSLISDFVSGLRNMFRIPELRNKVIFTALMLTVYRLGSYVPLPGVNTEAVGKLFEQLGKSGPGMAKLFQMVNMFAGGAVQRCTIFALGIMPYISASIIFQLLTTVYQPLKKLSQEGEAGRKKINQYTRYFTVGLSIFQAMFITKWLASSQSFIAEPILPNNFFNYFLAVLALTTGTTFLMWLGEQITEKGIGNGISLIIMIGIVAGMIPAIYSGLQDFVPVMVPEGDGGVGIASIIGMVALYVAIVASIVLITLGHRRITVQQAKQTRGRKQWGGQRTYMPIRVNHAGVIPIIFAASLMTFPGMILPSLKQWAAASTVWFIDSMMDYAGYAMQGTQFVYLFLYVMLIIFFCYFWTSITFQPAEVAERMKEYGSFLPGVRPGRRTADTLEKIMERITLAGSVFLATIAICPMMLSATLGMDQYASYFHGGTGLLIVVGVALDLVQKVENQMLMRHYEGFMKGRGRVKGRGPRPR